MTKGQNAVLKPREETVTVVAGIESGASPPPTADKPSIWAGMASAPKDGNPLWLRDKDKNSVFAYWRSTRRFHNGAWEKIEFWAVFGQNPQQIRISPIEWMRQT